MNPSGRPPSLNASCGPGTLPQYLVQPDVYTFAVRLRPFVNGEEDPARLARQQV